MDAFTEFTNAYKNKEYAESNLESRTTHMMWENKNIPLPKRTVEGFYLVHESLFDEILKKYTDQE
jgi:hypothetical protein